MNISRIFKSIVFGIITFTAIPLSAQFVQKVTSQDNLAHMYFYNDQVGFISNSAINKTTDGGETWKRIRFTSNDSILYIFQSGHRFHFFNELNGIAVTTSLLTGGGAVMKTSDGGNTWLLNFFDTPVEIDEDEIFPIGFTDVHFFNANDGFAVGGKGRRIVTTNGGQTWTRNDMPVKTDYTDLFFVNNSIGFAASEAGLFKTTNGGSTWTNVDNTRGYYSIHFIDALNGHALASDRILRTTDGGITWIEYGRNFGSLQKIFFTDAQNGYVVGDFGNGRNLLVTRNGGQLWEPAAQQFNHSLTDVMFRNANIGYLSGHNYPDDSYFGKTTTGAGLTVPVTDFNFTTGNACLGDVIQFNNEGIESYTHAWYVNDVLVSNNYNLQHAFTEYGEYVVKLETSNNGFTTSHTETVRFAFPRTYPPDMLIFLAPPTCAGNSFHMSIKNVQSDLNYEPWFEGQPLVNTQTRFDYDLYIQIPNGIPHSGEIIVKTSLRQASACESGIEFPTAKVAYNVAPRDYVFDYDLTPSNVPVCTDSIVKVIIRNTHPEIYYEITNNFVGEPVGWYNNGGRGTGGDLIFSIPSYSTKGLFQVHYRSPCGEFTEDINLPASVVKASYKLNTKGLYTDEPLSLTSQSIGTNFEWDFGEGAQPRTSTASNPDPVTYNSPGAKVIRLKVTDEGGCMQRKDTIQYVAQRLQTASLTSCGESIGSNTLSEYYHPEDSDTDMEGNVVVTGNFMSPLPFAVGSYAFAMFLHKYDANGNLLWSREADVNRSRELHYSPNEGNSFGRSVSTDHEGNVYVVIDFTTRRVVIGNDIIGKTQAWSWRLPQVAVLKYSPDGDLLWTVNAYNTEYYSNGDTWMFGLGVDNDSQGNVYFTTSGRITSPTFKVEFTDGQGVQIGPPSSEWDPENWPLGNHLFKMTSQGKFLKHWYYGGHYSSASFYTDWPYPTNGKLVMGGKLFVDKHDRVVIAALNHSTQNMSDGMKDFTFGEFSLSSVKPGIFVGVMENDQWVRAFQAAEIGEIEKPYGSGPSPAFDQILDHLSVDPDNNAIYITGHWYGLYTNLEYPMEGTYKPQFSILFNGEEIWNRADSYLIKLNYTTGERAWANFQNNTEITGVNYNASGKLYAVGTANVFGMFNTTTSVKGLRTQGGRDLYMTEINDQTGEVQNITSFGTEVDEVLFSNGQSYCGKISLIGRKGSEGIAHQVSLTGACNQTAPDLLLLNAPTLTWCEDSPFQLFASGAQSYQWFPREGLSNAEISNPVLKLPVTSGAAVDTERIYTVVGYSGDGCTATQTLTVTVEKPLVDFSYTAEAGNLTIPFTVNYPTTGTITWDFGDGQTGAGHTKSHTYATPGTYLVKAQTQNSCGEIEAAKSLTIECISLDEIDFSWSWDTTSPNTTVSFTGHATDVTSLVWYFGDTHGSTLLNPQHTFAEHKVYFVTFEVMNVCGARVTVTKPIDLTCSPITPDFTFVIEPESSTVNFTSTSLHANSYIWNFGDGNNSQLNNPVYSFTEYKLHTVTLTARNGCESVQVSKQVDLTCQAAMADFEMSNDGLTATFVNKSSNATEYLWSFDDGNSSTEGNPIHTFALFGTYDVCLTASNYCSEPVVCKELTIVITGADEMTSEGIIVSPNPFNESFELYLDRHSEVKGIEVYDAVGKRIRSFVNSEVTDRQRIWMGDQHSGVYFLKVLNQSGKIKVYKIVKG